MHGACHAPGTLLSEEEAEVLLGEPEVSALLSQASLSGDLAEAGEMSELRPFHGMFILMLECELIHMYTILWAGQVVESSRRPSHLPFYTCMCLYPWVLTRQNPCK